MEPIKITTNSPEETQEVGRIIGTNAMPGNVVALYGDLGAGKTSLTQGILWGLESEEFARSPTFVLMAQYEARIPLYHIDLYRISSGSELLELGFEEYFFGSGISVIEWPCRASALIPRNRLNVKIDRLGEYSRSLSFSATCIEHYKLLESVQTFTRNMPCHFN